jgi:hypothetical protein
MICHGPAPDIIALALKLGILARPSHSSRVGVGEALEVSNDLFWRVDNEGHSEPFQPSPDEICQEWNLTTQDLIRDEWRKACETF